MKKGFEFGRFMTDWGVLIAFFALLIFGAVTQPGIFLGPENLRNIVNQNVAVGLIAIGMTFVIISGGIDLSVGSIVALAGVTGVGVLNQRLASGESNAIWMAAATCVGVGVGLGLLQGLLIAYGRIAPFVATLVGMVAFRSLAQATTDGNLYSQSPVKFPALSSEGLALPVMGANGRPLAFTWAMLAFVVIAVIAHGVLTRTRYGRYVVAVGANERAAHFSAVNTQKVRVWTYTLVGGLSGLAALFAAARTNSAEPVSLGLFAELDAIAAVVIGGASLSGGFGRVWSTVVGVLLIGVISNLLVLNSVNDDWQGVVKGLIILAAVLIQRGNGSK